MTDIERALLLVVAAAVMNAGFALPMKAMRAWSWQTAWLLWSVGALLLLPFAAAGLTVPHLAAVYEEAGASALSATILFGAGWGVAQVLFGVALARIGIGLTFALVLGTSACVGGLLPLLLPGGGRATHDVHIAYLGAILLTVVGIAACARGGRLREGPGTEPARATDTHSPETERTRSSFRAGLLLAMISGVCASCMSLGVAYGQPILHSAQHAGAHAIWLTNAIWLPLLAGGAVPNIGYCVYLHRRRRTAREYALPATPNNALLALLMAALWFGSSLLYGVAVLYLGPLGGVLGWPLFMSLIVIFASILGVVAGEWRGARRQAVAWQAGGVLLLCCSVFLLSRVRL